MLKIKDDVKLEELEKFGFKYFNDVRSYRYGCLDYLKDSLEIFINNARVITMTSDRSILELDVLYDLIKADLVEKIYRGG
ncbi:MAG: hypothetical protein IKF17_05710 [Clostridia bacterium]|nr:hypothetical protein [Clostridia bacterium]